MVMCHRAPHIDSADGTTEDAFILTDTIESALPADRTLHRHTGEDAVASPQQQDLLWRLHARLAQFWGRFLWKQNR